MYTTELEELQSTIRGHLETAQRADVEREEARLARFQSLLMYIDEAHGAIINHINNSFTTVRKEIEAVMADQRDHAEKMGGKQTFSASGAVDSFPIHPNTQSMFDGEVEGHE